MIDTNLLDLPLDQVTDSQFKNFYAEFMGEKGIREQSVVKGRVTRISEDWVTVDIQYKAEGIVPIWEFKNPEGEITVQVGDMVDVYLDMMENEDGALVLSKEKADLMKAWDEISKAVERDEVVSGRSSPGSRAACPSTSASRRSSPARQVDLRPVKNLDKLIGETYDFKIIKFNKKRGNIVLSRRVLLEQERAEKREETLEKLQSA
jgi:small subunit ribosomal protein S1